MEVQGTEIITASAALRGQFKFDEAINLIENNMHLLDPTIKLIGWIEAFKAAKEKGDIQQSKKYAGIIAQTDPDLPSIQPYL